MSKYFSFKNVDRIKINNLYEQLNRIHKETREMHMLKNSPRKEFLLEDLNQRENFIVRQIAELKNILKPSRN